MKVRCKFYCNSSTKKWDNAKRKHLYVYTFSAVTAGSPENLEFFAYTPSGVIELATVANDYFEPGKEYYLDFSLEDQGAA